MTGIKKHNKKSWSDYQRYASHVYDEKYLLEIFHNEKDYEQQFRCETDSPLVVSNAKIVNWKSETNYVSRDGNSYYLSANFVAPVTGDYAIEVLYRTTFEGSWASNWNIDGGTERRFMKGSPEFRTRDIQYYHFQKGTHKFNFHFDPYIHVIGIVVKAITVYRADDSLKRDNRLTLTKAVHKVTKQVGADELSVEILYDSAYSDPNSLTNFLFDYRDEVNFYLINNDGEMEQIFGGYVSTCTLGSNETVLTINCGGRLIDGEKRYIVEEMCVGGEASIIEDNYPLEYVRRFDNYNDAVEYLFDNYEKPLNSNMHEIITAKQYDNINFDVSERENFDRAVAENVTKELMPTGVYLRNNAGNNQTQRFWIYNIDWYSGTDPILLDDYPILYLTYGSGEAVTTLEVEQTETTDAGATGGANVSDGGVVSTYYPPTCCCCAGSVPYTPFQRSWKNYCPWCGQSGTLGVIPKSPDGEVTCLMSRGGCDADYCCYCGGDKAGCGYCNTKKLIPASGGEVDANSGDGTGTGVSHSTENIIDKIVRTMIRYNYFEGVSTLVEMRKKGYGDFKAFSELIYSELVDMGVGAKMVQYQKEDTNPFFSVLVKNKEGNYVDFPYEHEEIKKHFGTVLNPTSASTSATVVWETDGLGVDVETGIIEGTVATSSGFDKDKPFLAHITMEYSISNGKPFNGDMTIYFDDTHSITTKMSNGEGIVKWSEVHYESEFLSHRKVKLSNNWTGVLDITLPNNNTQRVIIDHGEGRINLDDLNDYSEPFTNKPCVNWIDTSLKMTYIDFTSSQPDEYMTWSGLTPLFLNNIINTSSVNIIDRMRVQYSTPHIYLHRLYFEYHVGSEPLWEDNEENTDNASYKMILREVGFRNGTLLNPVDLGSTGKTVNSVLDNAMENGELKAKFYPAYHRSDDKIIVTRDKSFAPTFTIDESKNVLDIASWNFNPVSDFIDRNLVVYKNKVGGDSEKGAVYNYTETRNPRDVLRYGEINSVTSLSDDISQQEAYYNARKEFKSVVGDSMTITVFGCPPNLHLGDYVECLFENSVYNDVKEVKSIEHEYDIKQAPHIQTKLGLNRPNPQLALKSKFEDERQVAKEHKTLFSRTAIYDDDVYTWEE